VSGFLATQAALHQALDTSALYMVWAGPNDFTVPSPNVQTALTASTNLVNEVSRLYAAGARNFFVPTMNDLQYTADIMAAGPVSMYGAHVLSETFNAALTQGLKTLAAHAPGANIQIFDVNVPLNAVRAQLAAAGGNVTNPCWTGSSYGYADVVKPGTKCGNPDTYYLWDRVHPTAVVNDYVGKAFAAAVPEPEGYALALGGLLTVGALRLRQRRQA
jgi:phospholipase/lecithinase/hemolysin